MQLQQHKPLLTTKCKDYGSEEEPEIYPRIHTFSNSNIREAALAGRVTTEQIIVLKHKKVSGRNLP
jgi:hypothetical protein